MDMKRCCTCKRYKPFSDFHRNRSTSDGYHSQCKDCCCEYNHTEARKAYHRKYSQTLKGRRSKQKYSQSAKGCETQRNRTTRQRKAHPEKIRARQLLADAIQRGQINRPRECVICGKKAKLHGHHHKGYAKENALDVLWLCRKCHTRVHREKVIAGRR